MQVCIRFDYGPCGCCSVNSIGHWAEVFTLCSLSDFGSIIEPVSESMFTGVVGIFGIVQATYNVVELWLVKLLLYPPRILAGESNNECFL